MERPFTVGMGVFSCGLDGMALQRVAKFCEWPMKKWLMDKTDCLIIKSGGGFCRD
jgi:hypothetical protein